MTEAALDSNLAICRDNTTRTFVERSSAPEGVTVPVYQFAHSGVPLGRAERDRLARGITEIHHSETNAPEPFVRVVFEPMPLGTVYTAGEVSPSVLLNCGIRAGRSGAIRRRIIHRCYDLVSEVTQSEDQKNFRAYSLVSPSRGRGDATQRDDSTPVERRAEVSTRRLSRGLSLRGSPMARYTRRTVCRAVIGIIATSSAAA